MIGSSYAHPLVMKTAETAWNADLRSAQRAEGPRAMRRYSPWTTEIREHLLGPVAPRERTIPQVSAPPCAAQSRSACRPEVGVPGQRRHQGTLTDPSDRIFTATSGLGAQPGSTTGR